MENLINTTKMENLDFLKNLSDEKLEQMSGKNLYKDDDDDRDPTYMGLFICCWL